MTHTACYQPFSPRLVAERSLNYLTGMVDRQTDCLPYWLIAAQEKPCCARHVRVDDAELVASWYEAMVCTRAILGPNAPGAEVQAAFRRHTLKSWGEHGLRFHEPYPWTHTLHASFHEQGWVLAGLNRMLEQDPADREAHERAGGLVRGLRKLAIRRQVKTFWSGDYPEPEPIYEFPNDVYLQQGGFDLSRHTGRGEQAIRNGVLLQPLVRFWELTNDTVALDLAKGLANHLLGPSRYFNWKGEFFGHVHSAMWVACGLVRLGRLAQVPRYIEKGRQIYDYVRSLSSTYGWVPEYAQWHPMSEEHCETCCIKDMIECALELVDAGLPQYWTDADRFTRNHLVESQIIDGGFVAVEERPDTPDTTWHAMDRRIVGGFSGGTEGNAMSLKRFRSVAGCCVGTAPQALHLLWRRAVEQQADRLVVNSAFDHACDLARVACGYPNAGTVAVTPAATGSVALRSHPWMGEALTATLSGRPVAVTMVDGCWQVDAVSAGATVTFSHPLPERQSVETVRGKALTVHWRGPDVVDITPHPDADDLRLYQRRAGVPYQVPRPPTLAGRGMAVALPTEQKK